MIVTEPRIAQSDHGAKLHRRQPITSLDAVLTRASQLSVPAGIGLRILFLAFRSRVDPGQIVLGNVERFELFPCCDGFWTRRARFRFQEVGHKVDVATVRDRLESRQLVQGNVATRSPYVGCFPPAICSSRQRFRRYQTPDFSRTSGAIMRACSTMKSFVSRLLV